MNERQRQSQRTRKNKYTCLLETQMHTKLEMNTRDFFPLHHSAFFSLSLSLSPFYWYIFINRSGKLKLILRCVIFDVKNLNVHSALNLVYIYIHYTEYISNAETNPNQNKTKKKNLKIESERARDRDENGNKCAVNRRKKKHSNDWTGLLSDFFSCCCFVLNRPAFQAWWALATAAAAASEILSVLETQVLRCCKVHTHTHHCTINHDVIESTNQQIAIPHISVRFSFWTLLISTTYRHIPPYVSNGKSTQSVSHYRSTNDNCDAMRCGATLVRWFQTSILATYLAVTDED